MASKDNKGFSLTEVVVSVAVLLLLLSPILSQMLSSIKTQSLAKERLYALENANSVLEVVKSSDKSDIESRKGSLFDVENIGGSTVYKSDSHKCKLFYEDNAGNIVELHAGDEGQVEYNYTDYILTDAAFGKNMYKYSRVVTIDDLPNKVKAFELGGKHYNVVYGLTKDDVTNRTIAGYDFVLTNEGSYVSYDSKDYGKGSKNDIQHVKAILVKENSLTTTYSDPNAIDLGHIQDLDETKVAIVEGSGSNFDVQAEEDFYNLKLQHLKEINPTQWQNLMVSEVNESIFSTAGYSETVNKLTTIILDSELDASKGLTKYTITVNVSYEDKYQLPIATSATNITGWKTLNDSITYRVYNQEFYTDRCPDVYLMYEPYVYNSSEGKVQYRSVDNISVDNRINWATDGATGDITDTIPNIYLIRPNNTKFDKLLVDYQDDPGFRTNVIDQIASKVPSTDDRDYWKDVYYTDITNTWKPVGIHIYQTDHCTTDEKKVIPIYTDIPFTFDSTEANNLMKQWISTERTVGSFPQVLSGRSVGHYYESKILDISTESREGDGRLYTATVTYRRLNRDGTLSDGYDIRFQSGKGAD